MTQNRQVEKLRQSAPAVLPSLLLCDFGNLERDIRRLEEAGVKALHLDVMDGHFVPNLTYGMPIVEACRRLTDLPLDVHLMISNPADYVNAFVDAGADLISFHVEAVDDPRPILERIRAADVAAGIALNPPTPLAAIESSLDLCDFVLVMSVQAGFGGQTFQSVALEKLQQLHQRCGDRLMLEIDGGINRDTIRKCHDAGGRYFVVGSAIFREADYGSAIDGLTELISKR